MPNIKLSADFTEAETKRFKDIYSKLPLPKKSFNPYGLKYEVKDLNALDKKLIFFPLEVMAGFADMVCQSILDNKARENQFYFQIMEETPHTIRATYKRLSATGIGNMAFMALNFPDEKARQHCLMLLEEIFVIELSKRN